MLTPLEALLNAFSRSTPEEKTQIIELMQSSTLVNASEQPDFIVGGRWPIKVAGVQRVACGDCGRYVGLSPQSGGAMHAKYPEVPVLCLNCGKKRVEDATSTTGARND
jgi:hypothetical protein